MTVEFRFKIPESLSAIEFAHYLKENVDLYRSALDLTGDYFDRKSQVDHFVIDSIDLTDTTVVIHYSVGYSGFRPCQDLSYSEVTKRQTSGKRQGYEFSFQEFQPLERRSTCDE